MAYIHGVDQSKLWAIDVEGDLIPSTKVHLLCCINADSGERVALRTYSDITDWIDDRLEEGCQFIAHNGIGYDFPTLNRILGTVIGPTSIIDTNVMSQLFNPSMKVPAKMQLVPPDKRTGPHSLKAWGYRINFEKIEFDDFTSGWSPEMETYCFRDAEICLRVYKKLAARMIDKGFTETGLEIEHRAWAMIQSQKRAGFYFNIEEAHHLYNKLRGMEKDIEGKVDKFWPPERLMVHRGSKARKADGSFTHYYLKHYELYPEVIESNDGGYLCFDDVHFAIGSPNQRREKLVELGWKPREWTDSGLDRLKQDRTPFTPEEVKKYAKPTEKGQLVPSLKEFVEETGNEQVKLIANWMEINSRANMVNTWIMSCADDNCIHGSLYLANTLRYKHSSPNTANIPAVRLKKDSDGNEHPLYGEDGAFTAEARSLWTHRPGNRKNVGVDAKGIQLRVLAHHLGNKDFTESILSVDPHTSNMKKFNLPSRALTKTITYALIMGAGDPRISAEAQVSMKEAKDAKALFFERIPEFSRLINKLKAEQQATGRITLCSGCPNIVSEDRLVIPYLLQGDEAVIMKHVMWLIYIQCHREKIDAIQVGMIHDELQFDVLEDHIDRFIEICLDAFLEAGEYFNYSLPIEGDAKVGDNWGETH